MFYLICKFKEQGCNFTIFVVVIIKPITQEL